MNPAAETSFELPEAYIARRAYCKEILKLYHDDLWKPTQTPGPALPPTGSTQVKDSKVALDVAPLGKIAVVGGGVSGLSTAMMLGKLCEVDVYEAGDRVGGRLYTHKFKNGGEWDYFDVGAMRFPKTKLMQPTFDLFEYLGLPTTKYIISQDANWLEYNSKRYRLGDDQIKTNKYADDPFGAGIANGGNVPDVFAQQDPSELLRMAIGDLVQGLIDDHRQGIARLLTLDKHSTRSYLMLEKGFDAATVEYMETMSFGTGWFDRALTETVLEELCFQYDQFNKQDKKPLDWHCVVGGSETIIRAMEEKLKTDDDWSKNVHIKTKHRVDTVFYDSKAKDGSPMTVSGTEWTACDSETIEGSNHFQGEYSHVIVAVPPPCVRTIDISACKLDYQQRNAFRTVSIGPSCKIGMKFKTAWWGEQGITGGQSKTDRMVRTIVYPSYGNGESTALIASYAWSQDSESLGALIQGNDTLAEGRLQDIVLADLAAVHGLPLDFLKDQFEEMYAWDWAHHPNSMGAFRLFGPNQYQQYYTALTRPAADGHIYFVGDTISTVHGWVAGALESAQRAVFQLLKLAERNKAPQAGSPGPVADSPPVELVAEFKKTWSPDFGVDEELLVKQLRVSQELQQLEFVAAA